MKPKKLDFILSGIIVILLILESDLSVNYFNKYNYIAIIFWLIILYFVLTILIFMLRVFLKKYKRITSTLLIVFAILFTFLKPFTVHNFTLYYKENSYKGYNLYEKKSFGCAEALEPIYTDDDHTYYFTCIRSQNYYISKHLDRFTIKDGLETGKIKIEDLLALLDGQIQIGDNDMFTNGE